MAEPGPLLVVALSGRALAVAALRAGRPARVLDLFGDLDTRAAAEAVAVVPGDLAAGLDADALVAAAARLAPPADDPRARPGLVYGAGLEDRPELIGLLAAGRRLHGNPPEVVAAAKDPEGLAALLARLGVAHPPVTRARPRDPRGWLAKRVGGSGGGHVAPAGARPLGQRDYLQRRVRGRALSATFLADGRRARLMGFAEPWTAPAPGSRYRFGGVLGPVAVPARVAAEVRAALDGLTAALGLVGLNGLDLIVSGERWHAIELNPRPGASLDLLDHPGAPSLLAAHLDACGGLLPAEAPPPPPVTAAVAVVYAARAARWPDGHDLPGWAADRPAPGARFGAGDPVCTVRASGGSPAAARAQAARRVEGIRSLLQEVTA